MEFMERIFCKWNVSFNEDKQILEFLELDSY